MKKIFCLFLLTLFFSSVMLAYAEGFEEVLIEGWSFEKIAKGEKIYSVEADKASFGNKRIGFFNIAFIKVINLDNVYLTVYNNGVVIKRQHFDKAVYDMNRKCLFDEDGKMVFSEQDDL